MTPGRILAASILEEVESGRRLDVAWEASGASASPERGWIRTLVYGPVRLRGRIDHLLSRFHRPRARRARSAGPHGAAHGRFPDPGDGRGARLRRRFGVRGAGQGDRQPRGRGVGQRGAQEGGPGAPGTRPSFPGPETDLEGYLATWGSHPAWLVRRWIRTLGPEAARALVEANNREPDIYIRPVGMKRSEAVRALAASGLCAADSPGDDGGRRWIRLQPRTDPAEALRLVPGVIQDPAASLVVDYVAPDPGSVVARSVCGAGRQGPGAERDRRGRGGRRPLPAPPGPGGRGRGPIGCAGVAGGRRRARFPPVREAGTVLVDAPCSGTGTFRRHPDARWRVAAGDIGKLAAVQRALLDGAASAVPRGGLLVYATCTLEPEENWCQVESFLVRRPGFRVEPGSGKAPFLDRRRCLRVLPHESGFDGAFAARLRRMD